MYKCIQISYRIQQYSQNIVAQIMNLNKIQFHQTQENNKVFIFIKYFINLILKINMQKINERYSYNPEKVLGQGSFGKTYEGYDKNKNKNIAVKEIKSGSYKSSQQREKQLGREKKVMQALSKVNHSNIMEYIDYCQNSEGKFFILELCRGGNLDKLRKENISELKAVYLFQQLLQGLNYLHLKKITHRDLKPQNILLDENHTIKIADYGLARQIDTDMTNKKGSLLYQAPQVYFGPLYDERCDVWSLGLILYEILTGEQYFREAKSKEDLVKLIKALKDPKQLKKYPSNFEEQWTQITNFMLIYDFKERPAIQNIIDKFRKMVYNLVQKIQKKMIMGAKEKQMRQKIMKMYQITGPYVEDKKKDEQKSNNNLINVGKYLKHFQLKNKMLLGLGKAFKSNYNYIKNVHKYLLLFIADFVYITRISKHNIELNNMKVNTPYKSYTIHDFIPAHQQQFKAILKQYQELHMKYLQKYKKILQQQVVKLIWDKYMQRNEDKQIILKLSQKYNVKYGSLVDHLQQINNGHFIPKLYYMQLYRQIINTQDFHYSINHIKNMQIDKQRTYALIRILGNIDKFIDDENYQVENYISLKQQLPNSSSPQELIELISQYN